MLPKKMLQALKKIPQQLNLKAWKIGFYFVLMISWAVIIVGTFSLIG